MSASNFLAVGNVSVNTTAVLTAEWVDDPANFRAGNLVVHLGVKDHAFPFDADGVAELAAAVGLGKQAEAHAKEVKAKEDAAKAAESKAAE